MSIRKVSFVEGEYYHIYNRGNSKQVIFKDKSDYHRFIDLLYFTNTAENLNFYDLKRANGFDVFSINKNNPLVAIGAYVLMPNHFHILLTPIADGGVSKFMQKLSTSYSMYFNNKYKRSGGLFEGKFKSQHANTDRYLKYLFSYIHLNPIKLIDKDWKEKGIKNKGQSFAFLGKYGYSSYLDYIGQDRSEKLILDKKLFPNYFPNKEAFKREIFDWINTDL